ncbi:Ide [Symbiodinium natans]|uniref:Ide protein n=1 Tax=Symbiodinium natans TaxID=878477 RepID=A0A812IDK6_9DINO|nr:Ide [Symbiodinium natans]
MLLFYLIQFSFAFAFVLVCAASKAQDFDISKTNELVQLLTVENVRVTHQAKVLEERCTDRDTSYDSPMKFEELPEAWRHSWTVGLNRGATPEAATAFAEASKLRLPSPNPFIPEDLEMKAAPSPNPALPQRLPGAPKVVNYVFHRQDDVFMQPKALLLCVIRTPFISQDATSFLRASIWSQLVQEALSEFSYDAEIASCSYSLDAGDGAIMLSAAGFHDKLGVLIEAVTAKMLQIGTASIDSVPENFYNLVADRMADALKNQAYHSRPLSQASRRFSELTKRGGSFTVEELLAAFEANITRESICNLVSEMFGTCHAEALIMGNQTPKDALDLVGKLEGSLGLKCPLKELPLFEEAQLPAGRTLWRLDSTDKDDPNHAVILKWQFPKSVEVSVRLLMVGKLLSSKFFDVLRTQQQLGYIVGMGTVPGVNFSYITAQVQSEFGPDFVRSRIDAFFTEHFAWLEDGVQEEEFQTCLRGVLSELKMKPKNLSEEFSRFHTPFVKRTYDFDRKDKQIALLESGEVNLAELQRFVREDIRAAPALYVQVRKVLEKPDKPMPEGAVVPEASTRDLGDVET